MHAAPDYVAKMHYCAYARGDVDKNDSLWQTNGQHDRCSAIVLVTITDDRIWHMDVILSDQEIYWPWHLVYWTSDGDDFTMDYP